MENEQRDTRNTRLGVLASVGVHLVLLLCFLFITSWKPPDPPIPEYGIELQFGLENMDESTYLPEEQPEQEVMEELEQQVPENTMSADDPALEKQDETLSEVASVIPAEKKTSVERKKTPEKVSEQSVEPVPPTLTKKKKNNSQPTPPTPVKAVYKKPQQKKPVDIDSEAPTSKGNKQGKLDAKALYSHQGEGVGLDLAGWTWDEIPKPYIPRDESGGRIEFEIKVDENGEIIAYRVLERSLSIAAERACRKAISQLTFTKKKGAVVPLVSIGKITFVVHAK